MPIVPPRAISDGGLPVLQQRRRGAAGPAGSGAMRQRVSGVSGRARSLRDDLLAWAHLPLLPPARRPRATREQASWCRNRAAIGSRCPLAGRDGRNPSIPRGFRPAAFLCAVRTACPSCSSAGHAPGTRRARAGSPGSPGLPGPPGTAGATRPGAGSRLTVRPRPPRLCFVLPPRRGFSLEPATAPPSASTLTRRRPTALRVLGGGQPQSRFDHDHRPYRSSRS